MHLLEEPGLGNLLCGEKVEQATKKKKANHPVGFKSTTSTSVIQPLP